MRLVILWCLLLACPATAYAQTLGPGAADVSPGEYDSRAQLFFVPELSGALSVDLSLLGHFPLASTPELPSSGIGATAGYRLFFDGHGRLSLRMFGLFDYGGLVTTAIEGSMWRYGGGVALLARGYTQDFAFGSIGIFADASALRFEPPDDPLTIQAAPDQNGWQVGVGAETSFGALFTLAPYVFAETGASIAFERLSLGERSGWQILARWVLRVDWAR